MRPRPWLRLDAYHRLLQCPRCLLAWWPWPRIDPGAFYDRDYFQSAEHAKGYNDYAALRAGLRRTATARLAMLARLGARPPGRLFDIGCGTGVFLDTARQAGWSVAGLEVSTHAASVAQGAGLDICCEAVEGFAPSADQRARFDCVTMWDCIEHLRDPAGAVSVAAALLRPGGCLALSTGDVTSWCARLSGRHWHLFNLPEHLFFFSPKSLVLLLAGAGLQAVGWRREVNWVSVAYVLERLRKTLHAAVRWRPKQAPGTIESLAAQLFVPATLADVVGVYARKPHPRTGDAR